MSYIHLEKIKESKATIKSLDDNKRKNYEQNSGFSFKDVEVHYNSDLPNKVKCHGLTFGSKIAIAPGKEHVLDHELGHVMQQKQHRIHAQQIVGGDPWNFNKQKEVEATSIGNQLSQNSGSKAFSLKESVISQPILQGVKWEEISDRNDFIMDEHHKVIEETCQNQYISFRKAGEDTIKRMELKSGHKGHNVLEKSIKDKTIKQLIDNNGIEDNRTIEDTKQKLGAYKGLIGHWDESMKELIGVYVSQLGISAKLMDFNAFYTNLTSDEKTLFTREDLTHSFNAFVSLEQFSNDKNDKEVVYVKKSPELEDLVKIDGKGKIFSRLFLTGDYDIHDIKSDNEKGSLRLLNNKLMEKTDSTNGADVDYEKVDTSYIRHGAQANYVKYMSENSIEHGKKMPYAVINADPDLLFYNPQGEGEYAGWYRTKSMDDLLKYYAGVKIPSHAYFGETRDAHIEQAKVRYDNLKYKEGKDDEDIEPLVKKYNDKLAKTKDYYKWYNENNYERYKKNNYEWHILFKKRYVELGIASKEKLNENSGFETVKNSLLCLKGATMGGNWKEAPSKGAPPSE